MSCGRGETDAVGFVLAGGQSRRMGTDKAFVELGGRPLIAHAVGILQSAGLEVFIAGARAGTRSRLGRYAPVVPDSQPGLGPLGGICTALASLTAEIAVFLPVDLPLIPPSLIRYLAYRAGVTGGAVTMASVNGVPQPFPVVLARRALPALERRLAGRLLGCFESFIAAAGEMGECVAKIDAEVLVQSGQVFHPNALPVVRWFLNLNTGQDLLRAGLLAQTRVS